MAEHANNTGAGLPGLTGERLKAIATILVTLYSLANAGLNLAGVNTLPFTDEQVSAAIFAVLGVCGTLGGGWQNQYATPPARGAARARPDADEADERAAGSMPESDDAPGEI